MRIGSLFSGYGGLCHLTAAPLLGADIAWFVDNDKAAAKVLAHWWPDTPNLGDITQVDWSAVAPVDILAGGFPCVDVSSAGKRAGLRPDTRSGLWSQMAFAISQLRPRLVLIENVRGLSSARADSDMERCPFCVGDEPDVVVLRALGAVLGDLADLGYDAVWCGLRAASVGAPHGRFRIFLAAHPAGVGHERTWGARAGRAGLADGHLSPADPQGDGRNERRAESAGRFGRLDAALSGSTTPDADRDGLARQRRELAGERDADGCGCAHQSWGDYEPAIVQWESILERPPAVPTVPGSRANRVLNPVFVEWMMGLPEGHVTGAPGLSRNDMLRLLGNGVVPAQGAAAFRHLLPLLDREQVAA